MSLNNPPLVSILMNCYNSEKWLKEAIDSVYVQTYQHWEIIFVDNCSIDSSASIATSYDDRIKYHKTDSTIPLGAARNWGLQFVSGKYLAFLDTDDLWLPHKLSLQVSGMERHSECQFGYSAYLFIDEASQVIGRRKLKSKTGDVMSSFLKRYDVNMQTAMIKYDKTFCRFREDYSYSPDHELFMRLASKFKAHVISEPLVKYRKVIASLSIKTIDRWSIEHRLTLDAVLKENPELKETYPAQIKQAYAKVQYYKALYDFYINQDSVGKQTMKSIRFTNMTYFGLYVLSVMPFDLWRVVHRYAGRLQYPRTQ